MLCEEHSILKKETTDVDGRKMNTCREIGLLIQEVSLENVATTFSLQQQLLIHEGLTYETKIARVHQDFLRE